jgi:hypothetical protein
LASLRCGSPPSTGPADGGRVVDTDLQLEVQKLFDHKARHGELSVYEASRVIDMLKACPKMEKVA